MTRLPMVHRANLHLVSGRRSVHAVYLYGDGTNIGRIGAICRSVEVNSLNMETVTVCLRR